ncbi:MAG: alpha-L-fucosidase, partial [Tannerellaceae bacterium]
PVTHGVAGSSPVRTAFLRSVIVLITDLFYCLILIFYFVKTNNLIKVFCVLLLVSSCGDSKDVKWENAVKEVEASHLARPTKVQYERQEMELAMFIQLDPATIQEGEYDDGSTKLEDIKFERLDVNQWCNAAKAFGAKEIVFMLAHSGGFCMWPSSTTQYHIGNTPYKGGNGDVVKEFAQACRDNGLKAGFYLWAPHPSEEGDTKNTVDYSKIDQVRTREQSNDILKIRFHEIMDRLGSDLVTEIWIDQPIKASIGKEIAERAPHAVVAAVGCHDPYPSIRWPGTETGTVSDPCWSTTTKEKMSRHCDTQFEADQNQSQEADDPNGDFWAPHEADTQLHHGCWHMRPDALSKRKTVEELMNCYIKSVGRNSFLILNGAPMADGSIHSDDLKRYEEFGREIERRFGHPIASVEKIAAYEVVLDLDKPIAIGYSDLGEAYQYGQRIRSYEIDGYDATTNQWIQIATGTSVGKRKIDVIEKNDVFSKVRAKITSSVGTPLVTRFQIHSK